MVLYICTQFLIQNSYTKCLDILDAIIYVFRFYINKSNECIININLFLLAGCLNCLAGQRVYLRVCGSDLGIAGKLGGM